MATIVDPAGSPSVVYNRSGTTIVELAATGTSQGSGAAVSALSRLTIVLVGVTDGNQAIVLPSAAEVGDVVEAYCATDATAFVFPPSGAAIGRQATNAKVNLQPSLGLAFRKVSATSWQPIGQAGGV